MEMNNKLGFLLVLFGTGLIAATFFYEVEFANMIAIPVLIIAGFVIGNSYKKINKQEIQQEVKKPTVKITTQKKQDELVRWVTDMVNWVNDNQIEVPE